MKGMQLTPRCCFHALAVVALVLIADSGHLAAAERAAGTVAFRPAEPCQALFLLDCHKERPAVTMCDAVLEPAGGRPGCAAEPEAAAVPVAQADRGARGGGAVVGRSAARPPAESEPQPAPARSRTDSRSSATPDAPPVDELSQAREALRLAIIEFSLDADLEIEPAPAGGELILRVPEAADGAP